MQAATDNLEWDQEIELVKLPFDPSTMVLEYTGSEGVVQSERLAVEWIRARFIEPPAWEPEMRADSRTAVTIERTLPASVLIPIVEREAGATMLLTRRTDHLHDHPGQISFPGGRADEGDATAIETALREAEEEISLNRRHIDVIGSLPEYVTASGYRVTPVVSIVHPPFRVQADPFEVAEVFEVPLAFLMNAANHRRLTADFPLSWGRRSFYAIPYEQYFIWGATAGMLRNLFHFLRA